MKRRILKRRILLIPADPWPVPADRHAPIEHGIGFFPFVLGIQKPSVFGLTSIFRNLGTKFMPTLPICLAAWISVVACCLHQLPSAHGQLTQVFKDYKHDRPFQYAPNDPWTRSNLFHRHTKHYGLTYNCDGEECKRNSPYIYWKTHHENDLPQRTGWWQHISQTASAIKQRIADGACMEHSTAITSQICQQCQSVNGCQNCIPAKMKTPLVTSAKTNPLQHGHVTGGPIKTKSLLR